MTPARTLRFTNVHTREQAAHTLRRWLQQISDDQHREMATTLALDEDADPDIVSAVLEAAEAAQAVALDTYVERLVAVLDRHLSGDDLGDGDE